MKKNMKKILVLLLLLIVGIAAIAIMGSTDLETEAARDEIENAIIGDQTVLAHIGAYHKQV